MALAYDGDQRTLYYSENVTKSISQVQLKRGEYTQTIIKGIGEVKGIVQQYSKEPSCMHRHMNCGKKHQMEIISPLCYEFIQIFKYTENFKS